MSNSNNTLSGGLAFAAFIVGAGCLSVSALQAGAFVMDAVPDPTQKLVLIAGIICILTGSQVITRMVGQMLSASASVWVIVASIGCIGTVEAFSIATSMTAFDGNLIHARRSQNLDSPEYQSANEMVKQYQAQIQAASNSRDSLPQNYVTKRQQYDDRITMLTGHLEAAISRRDNIDISSSGAAFDAMEQTVGVSQSDTALLFACLLSVIPLCVNLGAGALSGRYRKTEQPTAKKPQAPKLKVVA